MIILINLDVLHKKSLVEYYYDVNIDKGTKTIICRPSNEFMQYSGLSRVADDFAEQLNTVNFYFKLQDKHKFFLNCLKFGLMTESYQTLNLKEEDILNFAFRPDTLSQCFSLSNKEERLKIKETLFNQL